MEIIFDLLQDIRKRPNLYLGEASLELLNAFIGGCSFYCLIVNGYYPEFFPGFQEFVQTRYDIHTVHGWWSIIRSFCANDEEAFYKFFELLDEFLIITKAKNTWQAD